jgi:GH15 family glucan-1,4-alpha-glucosidase
MFRRLLELRNDAGLLAEEYAPLARHQNGKFARAFSYIALVKAAYSLSRSAGATGERTDRGANCCQAAIGRGA